MFKEVIDYHNALMLSLLGWLDNAFGMAETQRRPINGKVLKLPVIYDAKRNYTDLSPDTRKGNFVFWQLQDTINKVTDDRVSARFSVIFWFDYESVENKDGRDLDKVVSDIIRVLQEPNLKGKIETGTVYTDFSSVYSGYDLDDNSNQFLMQPYGAVRADVTIYADVPCA